MNTEHGEITCEHDDYGIPRHVASDHEGKRRYSYDRGKTWRSSAKSARFAATGEKDDSRARAALESRMPVL